MPYRPTIAVPVKAFVHACIKPSVLVTLLAGMIIFSAATFAELQNREIHLQSERNDVLNALALQRARLEGLINSNVQLVQGMVAVISATPDIDQTAFSTIAARLFTQTNQLRNVAAAPDMVVSLVYPLEGNRDALGLDYAQNEAQRAAAERVRDEGRMVLAGPVNLVQGGIGFVARYPVFVDVDGTETFWGIASAVIDADALYRVSGLADFSDRHGLSIAITGRDGGGADGGLFFGTDAMVEADPVTLDVMLPTGSWRLWAAPEGGWREDPPNTWTLRIILVLAGALLLVPLFLALRLNEERRRRILDQKRREQDLVRLSRRLELALDASQVGVWEINLTTGALKWDDRMFEIYGVDPRRASNTYPQWHDRLHPDEIESAERDFARTVEEGRQYVSVFRIITPAGEIRHIRALGSLYQDMGSSPRIIGVNWDATADAMLSEALLKAKTQAEAKNVELESARVRIEHNALHDSLTGLPNRRYLDQMLDGEVSRMVRRGAGAALLHIDLDRFKQINDTLGHAAGDAMLTHAAEVLKGCAGESDFVARIGGDEFVILSTAGYERAEISCLAERIIEEMRQPVSYKGHECRFGVSVGIASTEGAEGMTRQLLVNADIALYRAKRRGRSRYEFFTEALQAEITTNKTLADEILCALESDEFGAHYQPQFDAETLEMTGAEALARWNHPLRGLLAPAAFLDVAEELNVTATLDRIVLERSIADRKAWAAQGFALKHMSVNVSARRLHDEGLIAGLKALDLPREHYSFELVESIYLDESDDIVAFNIEQLKELGIGIEIDDFGTGYASIVSLLKLSPNRLKIDRQLIAPIVTSERQRLLVASIIEIGRSLGIDVVAEGVETREHVTLLRQMGCSSLQGFALARPMAAPDLLAFWQAQSWRKAG